MFLFQLKECNMGKPWNWWSSRVPSNSVIQFCDSMTFYIVQQKEQGWRQSRTSRCVHGLRSFSVSSILPAFSVEIKLNKASKTNYPLTQSQRITFWQQTPHITVKWMSVLQVQKAGSGQKSKSPWSSEVFLLHLSTTQKLFRHLNMKNKVNNVFLKSLGVLFSPLSRINDILPSFTYNCLLN